MAYTTINKPSDYFNTKLYTGTGSSNAITGVGHQPDFTWIKSRNNGSNNNHMLFDAVRGATKYIKTDANSAENTLAETLKSFNSDGFTVGTQGDVNQNSINFASWNWKAGGAGSANTDGSITSTVSANTTSGFSVVSYTGTGSSSTTGHGLNSAPEIMISKSRTAIQNWSVHTTLIDGSLDYLVLNDVNAIADSSFTVPTSTVIPTRVGSDYISYNFHSVKGFSKMGTYIGNGNADGPFIYTGFKPAWVMIKRTDITNNWIILDNKRDTDNPNNVELQANSSNAEDTANIRFDMLSNGWKTRATTAANNASGGSYIYMAFAEAPLVGTNNIPCAAR